MGLKIGAGWTKTTEDGKTYMSYSLNKEFLELCPQLKNLKINAFHIPQENRKNENSPGWDLILSYPDENKKKEKNQEEEIPL